MSLQKHVLVEEKLKKKTQSKKKRFSLKVMERRIKCIFFAILLHIPKKNIINEWFMNILSVHLHL